MAINKILVCALLLCFLHISAAANDSKSQLEKANNFMANDQVAEALYLYEELLNEGNESFGLFYNAGLAYLKENQLAKAILFLEKAKEIKPSHAKLNRNLRIANGRVDAQISTIPGFFISRYWSLLAGLASSLFWCVLHLIFLILASWFFYKWYTKQRSERSKRTLGLLLGFGGLSLLLLMLAITRKSMITADNYAIVMQNEIVLKSGPDERSNELSDLSKGVKVEVLDQIGDWSKVVLMDKEQGWIQEKYIRRI